MERLRNLIRDYREKTKEYRENINRGYIAFQDQKYYRADMELLSMVIRGLELGVIAEVTRLARNGFIDLPPYIITQTDFIRFALGLFEN